MASEVQWRRSPLLPVPLCRAQLLTCPSPGSTSWKAFEQLSVTVWSGPCDGHLRRKEQLQRGVGREERKREAVEVDLNRKRSREMVPGKCPQLGGPRHDWVVRAGGRGSEYKAPPWACS